MSLQPLDREHSITAYNVSNYMTIRQRENAFAFAQDWEIRRVPFAVAGIQNILQKLI